MVEFGRVILRKRTPVAPDINHFEGKWDTDQKTPEYCACMKSRFDHSCQQINCPLFSQENDTNFGSFGMPSSPIPAFLNLCSMYTRLASSKLIPRIFISR